MPVRAASHIAIGVREMERSLSFYRDFLGLRVAVDRTENLPDHSGENPNAYSRRAVYLRWADGPDETFIVLDQQLSEAPRGEPTPLFQIGVHHFALWVDDLNPFIDALRARGEDIFRGPNNSGGPAMGEPEGSHVLTVLMKDPDGNVVQLDQRTN
jgi:catechol 2,3-dioxygenase-like lactoylglutathione lyase family enzyme